MRLQMTLWNFGREEVEEEARTRLPERKLKGTSLTRALAGTSLRVDGLRFSLCQHSVCVTVRCQLACCTFLSQFRLLILHVYLCPIYTFGQERHQTRCD